MNEQEPAAREVPLRDTVLREVVRFGAPQRGMDARGLTGLTGASLKDIRAALAGLEAEGLIYGRMVRGTRRWVRSSKLEA